VSRRARIVLFALAGPGFTAVLVIGLLGLPAFGNYHGVYGLVVIGTELAERHATDLVTALNFDLRAFDTLGEEFILFASVTGVVLLLRQLRGESESSSAEAGKHGFAGASEALRVLSIALIALLVAFGGYVIVHGTLTPGGGFQGGVVLGAGPVAALLAGRYLAVKAITPDPVLEAVDAIGAAGYALFGLGGLVFAGVYLKNFLPLGIPGHLLSGGFMPLNSIAVGIEVAGGFLLIWTEFLDQALVVRAGDGQAARA
jgi:multicomponent Na+:H+ antiporter subunit B